MASPTVMNNETVSVMQAATVYAADYNGIWSSLLPTDSPLNDGGNLDSCLRRSSPLLDRRISPLTNKFDYPRVSPLSRWPAGTQSRGAENTRGDSLPRVCGWPCLPHYESGRISWLLRSAVHLPCVKPHKRAPLAVK